MKWLHQFKYCHVILTFNINQEIYNSLSYKNWKALPLHSFDFQNLCILKNTFSDTKKDEEPKNTSTYTWPSKLIELQISNPGNLNFV